MQPQDWKTLSNEIHAKCIAYDYSDSGDYTLSEYITNLLQTGNQIDQINQELQQLVGSDYDVNLTAWMFSRIEELENPAPVKPAATSHSSGPKPNRIFAQAIGSVNRGTSAPSSNRHQSDRSRSRSPERRERQRQRQRSPERKSPTPPSSSSFSILSRLGSSGGRQVTVGSGRTESRPSVFDRLGAAKPSSTQTSERCKHWPACNQGDQCPYFHPKTICPDFPNCPKDISECMFIHPEFRPSAPASMAAAMPPKKPFPCRYFPYCTNPVCPFIHPDQPLGDITSKAPQQQKQQRVPIPCKNGENCKRPGCHFLHPGEENPLADVLCKYDGACTRPNCFYKHTVPPMSHSSGNKSLILNKKGESGNMSQRQFSVADDNVVERMVLGESADLISGSKPSTSNDAAAPNGEANA